MKVLALDFETSYNLCLTWGVWKQNIPQAGILKERGILMGSYSYLDPQENTYTVPKNISLLDYQKKNIDAYDDFEVVEAFHKLLSDVDVIIAHNGDNFDLKRLNTRLVIHGFDALPPVNTIDTLKIARRNFQFNHNRLDAIGEVLGLGGKEKSDSMWWNIICSPFETDKNKKAALKEMAVYCDRDVELLSEVYFALRKYDPRHPSFNLVSGDKDACPTCKTHGTLKTNDSWIHRAQTRMYPRYKCTSCGSWSRGTKCIREGSVNYRSI